ncbi:MAG: hypothetical protein HZB38_05790 [Planctomycetes bacterium]|nr:hypothetical protein [Planctomycetota bacterium]
MSGTREFVYRSLTVGAPAAILAGVGSLVLAGLIPTTIRDFHLPGTQVGDVSPDAILRSNECVFCHGGYEPMNDPYSTWSGSLMGQAGRDPLFYAQMATANQDVSYVGYFCMRCHVPLTYVSGHALQADGSTIDEYDRDGVNCHFCHSMVDPIYRPGISPPQDEAILAGMSEVPAFFGNSMFVLDPTGTRRGPYTDATMAPHDWIYSPFHLRGEFCGTCHDVGNVECTKLPDGTYQYNALDTPTPTEDLCNQFPLERTFTEWKLSAFANGGVDMGGRFGGEGSPIVSTCQDCHMPKKTSRACIFGPERVGMKRHDFSGAATSLLDIISAHTQGDPDVDQEAIARSRARSVDMLQRAATLGLNQECGALRTRVTNESGHKLPTGHIEGRRVWVNVRLLDAGGAVLREYGHYDAAEAHLDEASTKVYEMKVGLSPYASQVTGFPPGETAHMALADVIVKDNRIPPRGFDNAMYESCGAPAVDAHFADGQHWDDSWFAIPGGAVRADVTVYYQNLPRHYMEILRDNNHTDHWGQTLWDLYTQTGMAPPDLITQGALDLSGFLVGDLDCDCEVGLSDFQILLSSFGLYAGDEHYAGMADLSGNHAIDLQDLAILLSAFCTRCP